MSLIIFTLSHVPAAGQQAGGSRLPRLRSRVPIGELHNRGVQFVLSRLKEIPKPEERRQVVFELTRQYFASIKEPFPYSTVADLPEAGDNSVERVQGSEGLKAALGSVLTDARNYTTLREFNRGMDKLARQTSPTLRGEELQRFSHAVSVAKSSATFWAPTGEGGLNGRRYLRLKGEVGPAARIPGWLSADIIGCMAGWEFDGPGCLVGAIIGSVIYALT